MQTQSQSSNNEFWVSADTYTVIKMPEYSEWKCYPFGVGSSFQFTPLKGKEPNFFWRWMQYLVFGNEWVKDKKCNANKVI